MERSSDPDHEEVVGRPNEKLSYRDYRTFKLKGKKGVEAKRLGSLSAPEK